MTLAIDNLLAIRPLDRPRIEAFLRAHSFPLVEGRRVTFVFHGAADEVNLRHWIFGLPSSQPLHRAADSDLWHLTLEIPERSRIEYKIERAIGGQREWLMDPLNPRVARDPFGANSVCHGTGYRTPDWTLPDAEARPGELDEVTLESAALGGARRVLLYLPARFRRTRRYSLLVVHDGEDFLHYASLKTVLDNLIHRLEVAPLVVALTAPGDRFREYGADPRHARHLAEELLPALERRFLLSRRPEHRGLMGASLGAVAALHAAWSHPGVWGRLLLQSGSFAFTDIGEHRAGERFEHVVRFVNAFREEPGRPAEKVYQTCGTYESLIYENRSLYPLLQSTGMDVRFVEARDGHNWENWRDRLRRSLCWLFPGPLWMVYE